MSADVGSFVGLGDSSSDGSGPLAPSPFRLPAAYEEAKERKVSAVSDLRNAVKAVRHQSHALLQSSSAVFATFARLVGTEAYATGKVSLLQGILLSAPVDGTSTRQLRILMLVWGLLQAALDDAKKRELQAVIQSYFKDWLMTSGNMRQVYDLARMEREEASSSAPNALDSNNSLGNDAPMNMNAEPPL